MLRDNEVSDDGRDRTRQEKKPILYDHNDSPMSDGTIAALSAEVFVTAHEGFAVYV